MQDNRLLDKNNSLNKCLEWLTWISKRPIHQEKAHRWKNELHHYGMKNMYDINFHLPHKFNQKAYSDMEYISINTSEKWWTHCIIEMDSWNWEWFDKERVYNPDEDIEIWARVWVITVESLLNAAFTPGITTLF